MNTSIDKNNFGQWAIITGASSGIGEEFARQLAAQGFNIFLVARRLHLLDKIGKELNATYQVQYECLSLNLSAPHAADILIKATSDLDIGLIVSNAGTGSPGEFIKKDLADLHVQINTSVLTHLKLTHHFGKLFSQKRKGGIILVSAMGADKGLTYMAHDAATRAYILSLGLGLHDELKKHDVRLTVLIPSPTDTPIVEHLGFKPEKMPVKPITVKQCVEETIHAFMKYKSSIIPGRIFRVMNAMVPASVSRKMFAKMLADGNGIT